MKKVDYMRDKNKHIKLVSLGVLLFCCMVVNAQHEYLPEAVYGKIDTTWSVIPITSQDTITLPKMAMGKPVFFQNEEISYQWEVRAKQRDWGKELSNQLWQVYIDRDSVKAYAAPNRGAEVVCVFSFMNERDVLYVARIEGDFALLYSEKREHASLVISPHARPQGWVHLDELLLWSTCPRTVNQVYKKAFVLKDSKDVIEDHNFWNTSPEFSKSPIRHIGTKRRVTDLEHYFVYKVVNGNALLFPDSKINNRIYTSKMGWMSKDLYTVWNDRFCYEPNFGDDENKQVVNVYTNIPDAKSFKQKSATRQDSAFGSKCIWSDQVSRYRWAPDKMRLPVLEKEEDGISQVAVVSTYNISAKDKEDFARRIDNLRAKINELQKLYSKINIVFVMDGTPSMRKYYQPVANSITHAMAQKEMQGSDISFGAVIYRDYADQKHDRMIEVLPLTEDYKKASQWITKRECRSVGQKKYGAMYLGMKTALDTMKWSKDNCNFIVLVGDIANDPMDKRVTSAELIAKMSAYKVNFIAFQANHPDRPEYHNFTWQVQRIMLSTLRAITDKRISRSNFSLKNQLYTYRSEAYEIVSACFRFAEIDRNEKPEILQELVEDRIIDFKRQVNENLVIMQTVLEGLNEDPSEDPDFSTAAIAFLNSRGLTTDDIHLLKQQNITLKVKGYTSNFSVQKEVLIPSVFISQQELNLLISSLSKALQMIDYSQDNIYNNTRDALAFLAETFIGATENYNEMSLGDIFARISGLTNVKSNSVLANAKIDEVQDFNMVPRIRVDRFIKQLHYDYDKLVLLREDPTYYFDSRNELRYYYLLLEDMPFQLVEREDVVQQPSYNSSKPSKKKEEEAIMDVIEDFNYDLF